MLDFSAFPGKKDFLAFFEKISKIPRGSGNTTHIADYLENFAKERGLEYKRDAYDNLIIVKPAAKGYDDTPAVILQAHTDMVIATDKSFSANSEKDGVDIFLDGDFLRARGSTLGADNGMGVAFILAILDADNISAPKIEAVFTSNEEIGLLGAAALDTSTLTGKTYINLDAGPDGIFIAGCAGGVRIDITSEYETKVTNEYYSIKISGLRGGHSGEKINEQRANAIKLIGEIVGDGVSIGDLIGGSADNAIADCAEFKIFPLSDTEEKIKALKIKYKEKEKNISVECIHKREKATLFTLEDSKRLISLINTLHYGPISMNENIPTLVESSMNLGIITTVGGRVTLSTSVRSSSEKKLADISERVYAIAREHRADCAASGAYPGWEFSQSSSIRDILSETYREISGKDAKIITIHAGLECGIFKSKIQELDAISMGPLSYDIHTPSERASVPSAIKTYELLLTALKKLKGTKL